MSEIPKAYEPQAVEEKWYQFWLDQGAFVADPTRVSEKRPAYSIVIPPPNVTGVLTMGHVLNNTIQDVLARKARMDGKEVLWLPGTDHAGIATQTVVEKTLKKQGEIRHRDDLGRERFLERVWQWKEKHGGIIIQQLKKLGASCDWTRERFTMDPAYSRNVQKVFVDLFRKKLIYRGRRMVNWCPVSQTALSDEEVVMKSQRGSLYYFRVEVVEEPGTFLTIATTRPETIPGDTGVAVNPNDPRYARLVGKHVKRPLPFENQEALPIVADEHIDPEFGTGVLKVTPAHDKADFEIGQRHGLPAVDVIDARGMMTEAAGTDLAGLDRFQARKRAAEKLAEIGALEKEEPYTNNVGFSERADVPIEPRLSEQWFLKYPSTGPARECVANGTLRFHPDRWAKVYDHWMGGLQDWCISRQLWWGHRVPIWTRLVPAGSDLSAFPVELQSALAGSVSGAPLREGAIEVRLAGRNDGISFVWVAPDGDSDATRVTVATDSPEEGAAWTGLGFEQDSDVLDTWFSSWLWPFATMGWTGDKSVDEANATLRTFYPTTDLVTGPDIIFFWVARMIMAGYEYMGELPFRNVYFTGIIRDKQGRKMSKSLGNSPDPLDLIGRYGADALRFGTMRSAPLGQDILFDEQNVELGRNFCNKLWNACRFRQMQGGEAEGEIRPELLTSSDKWVLLKLDAAIREVSDALAGYRFNEATQVLYRFFWNEFCDWHLEAVKAELTSPDAAARANSLAVIDFVLSNTLRLLHPFLPFITEELWHGLGFNGDLPADQGGTTIMLAHWPKAFDESFKEFYGLGERDLRLASARYEVVTLGRNLRREVNLRSNRNVRFILKTAAPLGQRDVAVLRTLLGVDQFEVVQEYLPPKGTPFAVTPLGDLYLPLSGLIDVEVERNRLTRELGKIDAEIAKVEQKLGNPNFVEKVPPAVLEEHKRRLSDWQTKKEQVSKSLDALSDL